MIEGEEIAKENSPERGKWCGGGAREQENEGKEKQKISNNRKLRVANLKNIDSSIT